MPKVIAMHFVCRDDLNVADFGNGTFETGGVGRQLAGCSNYPAGRPP